jgi:hypothetical protein
MKKVLSIASEGYEWDENIFKQNHEGCSYEWGIKKSSLLFRVRGFFN